LDSEIESNQIKNQTLQNTLETTETDLANAVLVIQDQTTKIADLESKLEILQKEHDEKHEHLELHKAELEKIKSVDPVVLTDHLGNPVATYYPVVEAARESTVSKPAEENQVVIPDLSISNTELDNPTNAGFGTEYPKNPQKGDLFLRVDYLPNKLYKWNEKKWIEIDKSVTDRYTYDEQYIKHLVEKLRSGEYDYDLLTPAEQEQISRYINEQSNKQ
jgi:DNA-directed RNA polymerase subunit H (RpoH/RPB5)